VGARCGIIVQREDVDLVPPCEPLDQPHERRHHVATRCIESTRDHQPDTHQHMIKTLNTLVASTLVAVSALAAARAALVIYCIAVEGGQATLVVTPAGESLLVDTGFPGQGGFDAQPGDAAKARDANRIVAAAKDAGVSRIDYLLITHFHADHD